MRSKFSKLIKQNDSLIHSIRIKIDPWDAENSEPFAVEFLFLVDPSVHSDSENLIKLKTLSDRVVKIVGSCSAFDDPSCRVASSKDISLWEHDQYHDFSRYDYLSFGEDS